MNNNDYLTEDDLLNMAMNETQRQYILHFVQGVEHALRLLDDGITPAEIRGKMALVVSLLIPSPPSTAKPN